MKRKSTRQRPPRRPIARSGSRRNTAALITALTDVERATVDERVRQLVHELQVHAEEITAQNDELRRTQTELEQARSRYADLYDFAPIGFLTINRTGIITNINIAAAALLGVDRELANHLPFTGMFHNLLRPALRKYVALAW